VTAVSRAFTTRRRPIGIALLALLLLLATLAWAASGFVGSPSTRVLDLDKVPDGASTTTINMSTESLSLSGSTAPRSRVRFDVDGVQDDGWTESDDSGRFTLLVPVPLGIHRVAVVADTPPHSDRDDERTNIVVSRASDPPQPPLLVGLERMGNEALLTFWLEPGTNLRIGVDPNSQLSSFPDPLGFFEHRVTTDPETKPIEAYAINDRGKASEPRVVDLSDPSPRIDELVDTGSLPDIQTTLVIGRDTVTRDIRASIPRDAAGAQAALIWLQQGRDGTVLSRTSASELGSFEACSGFRGWHPLEPARIAGGETLQISVREELNFSPDGRVGGDDRTVYLCTRSAVPLPGTTGSVTIKAPIGLIEHIEPEPVSSEEVGDNKEFVYSALSSRQILTLTLSPIRTRLAEEIYSQYPYAGGQWRLNSMIWAAEFALPRLIPILFLIGVSGLGGGVAVRARRAFVVLLGLIAFVPLLTLAGTVARALGFAGPSAGDLGGRISALLSETYDPLPELRFGLFVAVLLAVGTLAISWLAVQGWYGGIGRRLTAASTGAVVLVALLFLAESAVLSTGPLGEGPQGIVLAGVSLFAGIALVAITGGYMLRQAAAMLDLRVPWWARVALWCAGLAFLVVWALPPDVGLGPSRLALPGSMLAEIESTVRRALYLMWLLLPVLVFGVAIEQVGRLPWERAARQGAREAVVVETGALIFAVFLIGFDGYFIGIPIATALAVVVFLFVLLGSPRQAKRIASRGREIRTQRGALAEAALEFSGDEPRESSKEPAKPPAAEVVARGRRTAITRIRLFVRRAADRAARVVGNMRRLLSGPQRRSTILADRGNAGSTAAPGTQAQGAPPSSSRVASRTAVDNVLALAPYRSRARNVRLGTQVAAALSLVVLPFYLVQLDTTQAWQLLAQGLFAFEVRWLVLGALFGLIYEYIRAPTGLSKGLWLGISAAVVRLPFDLVELSLGWTTVGVVAFSMLQLIGFATAVGLAFDVVTLRRTRVGPARRLPLVIKDALSLTGGQYVLGFATTLVSGGIVAITAQLSNSLNQLLTGVLRALGPTTPGP
jgi:hypothetical protein